MLKTCILLVSAGAVFAQKPALELPPPYATPSVRNAPKVVGKPAAAKLNVPPGFTIEEWATDFQHPRYMLYGPSGEILLTESVQQGAVTVLTNNGKTRKHIIENLDMPYGLVIEKGYLYVGERSSIKRYKYDAKAMTAGAGEEIIKIDDGTKGHWTRSLLVDSKASKLYVGVGSRSNVSPGEPEMRAAINRYNLDGSGHEIFAAGTRNPIGIHWRPGTTELWAAVQERDEIGDDLVPDFFTHIQQGGFYGWPYAYIGPHEDPRNKGQRDDLVKKTIVPDVPLPAHAAVLDYTFYTGKMFPAEYQGGAFLAFHGSWNRSKRLGYSVAFVPFKNGKPAGSAQDFLTGWMLSPDEKEVWGRPVAVFQMQDGSLLVSDDGGNKLWRISYKR